MARLRNNILVFFVTILSMTFYGPRPAFAADNTNANWLGTGNRWNTTEWKIYTGTDGTPEDFLPGTDNQNAIGSSTVMVSTVNTNVLRLKASTGGIQNGTTGTAISTTATSGNSMGWAYPVFLASGPASGSGVSIPAVEGSILCSTTSQQGNLVTAVVCVNSLNLTSVIGVAQSAASTGTVVNVYGYGFVLALTTGTVNAGDPLSTSSLSSGYLQVSASSATLAIALGSGPTGGGLTKVKVVR